MNSDFGNPVERVDGRVDDPAAGSEVFVVASRRTMMGMTQWERAVDMSVYATRDAAEVAARRLAEEVRGAFLSVGDGDDAERCRMDVAVWWDGRRHFTFRSWDARGEDRDTADFWVEACRFVG